MQQSLQITHSAYSRVANLEELKLKLKNDLEFCNFSLKFIHHKLKYLYVWCRHKNCKWQLRYRYDKRSQEYYLNYELLSHNHHYKLSSNLKSNLIENFIQNLPKDLSLTAAKVIVMQHLKISASTFYYYYRKVRFPHKSISQLIKELDKQNMFLTILPYQLIPIKLPDLLIIITPLMKQNFMKYGKDQFSSFDFTFNLIKQLHQESKLTFKLGCLVGLSHSRKIVPFALVIADRQTKDRYYEILKNISLTMQSFSKVLITDQSLAMIHCARQFQNTEELRFNHFLDIFHILRNVKKKLSNKNLLSIFAKLAKCRNKLEFQSLLLEKQAEFTNQNDLDLLKNFVDDSQSYCFSKLPSQFFGFVSSDVANQKIHDLIKTKIPTQRSYTQVIISTLELLQKLGKRCQDFKISKLQIETLYNFPYLKEIRYSIDQNVLKQMVKQIQASLFYQLEQFDQVFIIKTQKNHSFTITISDELQCQCNYRLKTGIPCSHLLRIFMLKKIEFKEYIHPRWLIQSNTKSKNKAELRGRGRITRRKR